MYIVICVLIKFGNLCIIVNLYLVYILICWIKESDYIERVKEVMIRILVGKEGWG